jgi:O-Antigen ligase
MRPVGGNGQPRRNRSAHHPRPAPLDDVVPDLDTNAGWGSLLGPWRLVRRTVVETALGRDESSADLRQAAVMLGAALPLAAASIVVGWMVGPLGSLPGLVLAGVVGTVGGVTLGRRWPEAVVLALVIATVFLGSPIVASAGRYLPSLACMVAVLMALILRLAAGQSLRVPPRSVSVLLIAYVVMATFATLTSIDPPLSAIYLAGIIASLGFAFVAAPTLLSTATARLAFVMTAAVIGLVLAASSVLLWILGPLRMFDQPLGIYLVTELRVGDVLTGVIVPRASGPYLTPGYQALNLAIGLFALIGIRPIIHRGRLFLDLGIALVVLATLLTMSRGGWLVAATGCLVIIAIHGIQAARERAGRTRGRSIDRSALASVLVIGVTLGSLLVNAIGADARYDLAKARYGDAASGSLEEEIVTGPEPVAGIGGPVSPTSLPVPVRGGAESSSRGAIWSASLTAIAARPITGYGPGTNADALGPFLTGPNEIYQGLSSHSTWLRTALEMGIPGFMFLIAFVLAAGWIVIRNLGGSRYGNEPWSAALIASAIALVVGQLTETLLLGGLTFASLYWAAAIGVLVARPSPWQFAAEDRRASSPIAASPD